MLIGVLGLETGDRGLGTRDYKYKVALAVCPPSSIIFTIQNIMHECYNICAHNRGFELLKNGKMVDGYHLANVSISSSYGMRANVCVLRMCQHVYCSV